MSQSETEYRGRLAPSPTGYLHLGHARTFWIAQERVRAARGRMILRNEDLDGDRCKPEFVGAMIEDLRWFGFKWDEGPFAQSERLSLYRAAFAKLKAGGFLFPCVCSRKDVQRALQAPHVGDDEPIYPGTCRDRIETAGRVNWRFRVPDGEAIEFVDGHFGGQNFTAGRDFGDFIVWRQDDLPAYQLAVVVDDADMRITEVVRGADLLLSTARQLLLYRALRLAPPAFYHCPLMTDDNGVRLAKRHDALSLRKLRDGGATPDSLRAKWRHCADTL
jgi:glutamyl/glutaminyl-tRNA synthetase